MGPGEEAGPKLVRMLYFVGAGSTTGTNKAASSGTSLNTRKLVEDTENLAPQPLEFKLCTSCLDIQ
ncbi:hypothetical protein LguiB_029999 [Lonicera macranthoides]